MNDAERYKKARDVYLAALDLEESQRHSFVEQECGDDATILNEVRSLIAVRQRDESPKDAEPPRTPIGIAIDNGAPSMSLIGRTFDGFTLTRVLGSGGMGVVYEAEQEHPRRTVAIKILRPTIIDGDAIRRFTLEADVLAHLHHPNIANIHQAGVIGDAGSEVPYFAMEYVVNAHDLVTYVASRSFTTRERLKFLIRICEAVHHGHQRGVIHRDLKPGNILVGTDGVPRVIDFGVARIADQSTGQPTLTQTGQNIGTPHYMSPEQLSADPSAIDVRTDVFALGVVMFELLTGRLPYDVTGASPFDVPRLIRESTFTRPSTINAELTADIDAICGKALEKDAAARYRSVDALADDIRRFLDHRPITARPVSRTRTLWLQVRRNPLVSGLVATLALAMIGGSIVSTTLYLRARGAQRAAELRSTELQAVVSFLTDTFASADPSKTNRRDVSIREAVDHASEHVADSFADSPLVAASVHRALGRVYTALGENASAITHLQRALDLRRSESDPFDPIIGDSLYDLATLKWSAGDNESSRELLMESLRIAEAQPNPDREDIGKRLHAVGTVLAKLNEPEEARTYFERALETRVRHIGTVDAIAARSINGIARLHQANGEYDQAITMFTRVYDIVARENGPDSPFTAIACLNLGDAYEQNDQRAEAEATLTEAVAILERVYGDTHRLVPTAIERLAKCVMNRERLDDAIKLQRHAVDIRTQLHGTDHRATIETREQLHAMEARLNGSTDLAAIGEEPPNE